VGTIVEDPFMGVRPRGQVGGSVAPFFSDILQRLVTNTSNEKTNQQSKPNFKSTSSSAMGFCCFFVIAKPNPYPKTIVRTHYKVSGLIVLNPASFA